jgi:hypothetical protein
VNPEEHDDKREPCACERCNRATAYRAIRRAATYARYLDYCATLCTTQPRAAIDLRGHAYAVRTSIRLAIDSTKETQL